MTLYGVEYNVTNEDWQPDPGKRFVLTDVEVCAGAGELLQPDMTEWELEMPGNTRFKGTYYDPPIKAPRFDNAALTEGQCLRGLIPFEVPEQTDPVRVIYEPTFVSLEFLPVRFEIEST